MSVSGKRIVITGGASGIGAASARVLASRGAAVLISDVNEQDGQALAAELNESGATAHFYATDVADVNAVGELIKEGCAKLGGIDVMINNAGVDHNPNNMLEVPQADFDRNIAINLAGVWHCMRAALPVMLKQGNGQIINIASVAGLRSSPMLSAYSAAKHGVIGLTKAAAVEFARANIRCNAICPSFVDTPMVQNTLKRVDEKAQRAIVGANPMKRLGKVEEIAYAIAWLSSDESSFMTGQNVVLDGGMLA
ncbi:SDR family NAD(P)-dependent oxidoreductase [Alteromonas sp. ASW11-36]|uniref:SDR family NAD(P)-dependent oxidoreductase n=1 Tax=Alteromonas arenosi TaxID=3055817 RepID=A0ABT7SX37_9ALTE|nr:SDR family NAD(P)-dependent oxidoreductase [Alteromonas sp. ASW11-36]MDM7860751.1 SDR family NAD(P)-dependent oxidoreductase [Alteromonas sp. ASW11-36]